MGLWDKMNPFATATKPITTGTMIGITEIGKGKAENGDAMGESADILTYLAERGPSTSYQMGIELHKDPSRVLSIVKMLQSSSQVRVMS